MVDTPTPRQRHEHRREPVVDAEAAEDGDLYICDDLDVFGQMDTAKMDAARPTLSEQLHSMQRMRRLDKDHLDLLSSPMAAAENKRVLQRSHSASSAGSCSVNMGHGVQSVQSITTNLSTPSSARSSMQSNSMLSIDEHLERWNHSQHGRLFNKRRSSANSALSSVSGPSGGAMTPMTASSDKTPRTALEQSTTRTLSFGDIQYAEHGARARSKGHGDAVPEEKAPGGPYDDYSYCTDDEVAYYSNRGGDSDGAKGVRCDADLGLEFSRRMKAKSAESPCRNKHRLSSSFALHWINLKRT